MRWHIAAAIAAWMTALPGTATRADSIATRAGGTLRGELLLGEEELATATEITICTLSGATVTLARDAVDHIVRRSPIAEEYNVRRRAAADSAEGQWALALWCHENALLEERDQHLRRVIDFNRSHKEARRMLGHHESLGRWWKPGEAMVSPGFVYITGTFVLPPDWDAFQNGDLSAAEKRWAARVLSINNDLMKWRKEPARKALRSLREIRDPDAVRVLEHYMESQTDRHSRMVVLEILSRIPGDRPLGTLVSRSLRDAEPELREGALAAVLERGADRVIDQYFEALRDPQRTIVNRAAYALGIIGDQNAVPALSDALATPEEYEEWALGPDAIIKTRRTSDRENPEVLRALILLTGENFGYDKPAWRTWFADKNNLSARK